MVILQTPIRNSDEWFAQLKQLEDRSRPTVTNDEIGLFFERAHVGQKSAPLDILWDMPARANLRIHAFLNNGTSRKLIHFTD